MKADFKFDIPLIYHKQFLISEPHIQYYGNISDGFPTGRPDDVEKIERNKFLEIVEQIKANGNEFNFLLNGVLDEKPPAAFHEYLTWIIREVKPDIITFSDPSVYHYILKNFNYTRFEISAITGISNKRQFDRYISHNQIRPEHINKIVFHHDVTRSIEGIANFVKELKSRGIHPRVLVTESCYYKCPLRSRHYKSFAKAYSDKNFVNYYQIHCIAKRLLYPESLLDLSGFLLPEQLAEYYTRTGIDTFKISGRSQSARWINRTATSYLVRKSPENIFEIIIFTAPYLVTFGMEIHDLFYLNNKAYLQLSKDLNAIINPIEKKQYLQEKAVELFLKGDLRINDPNSRYDIINGKLQLIKKGEYLRYLEEKADKNLKGTIFYKKNFISNA